MLTLVLLAAGVYVAQRHRRALIGASLGLAASMLVLAIALAAGRAIYLSKVPASVLRFAAIRGTGERAGVSTGRTGTWIYPHQAPLRIAAVGAAVLAFIFWTDPTGLVVVLIAIVLAVVLGLIELIGRPPARPEQAGRAGQA